MYCIVINGTFRGHLWLQCKAGLAGNGWSFSRGPTRQLSHREPNQWTYYFSSLIRPYVSSSSKFSKCRSTSGRFLPLLWVALLAGSKEGVRELEAAAAARAKVVETTVNRDRSQGVFQRFEKGFSSGAFNRPPSCNMRACVLKAACFPSG